MKDKNEKFNYTIGSISTIVEMLKSSTDDAVSLCNPDEAEILADVLDKLDEINDLLGQIYR